MKYTAVVWIPFIAAAHAAPHSESLFPRATGISWTTCDASFEEKKMSNLSIDCANVTAPLDYTVKQCNETINLELLRVPAKKKPSKGSILFNFGGPGDAGRHAMVQKMDDLMSIVGGEYNLVVFDTRGTVNTLTMTCTNATERAEYLTKFPLFSNASDTGLGETWAVQGYLGEVCYERKKNIGSYVGTAFTARDLMTVVDALGEDGMLRFWGLSYGTVLGATVSAMFPDRVSRVILDAVQNAHEYYHSYDEQMQIMADEAFSGFFKGCVDAKQACPLARHNMTASALENQFWKTLFKIKYAPLRSGTQIVDYYTIKNAVTGTLYSPAQFPVLAKALDDMYSGNLTTILAMGSAGAADTADVGITPEANQGIQCSDKAVRASNRTALMPTVEKKFDISRVLGDSRIFSDMACAQWQMEAKERYEGDFRVKTKNPLLFIGNTYDALTPYQSAFNMSSGFEGSGAIEQLSFGHGSIAQPSACTIKAIRHYLSEGKVPPRGAKCATDVPLFSGKKLEDVLEIVDGDEQ